MHKFRIFGLIIALLLISDNILSQFTWTRTFGGQFSNDEAFTTIQTNDGNYLTVGDSGSNGNAVSMIIKFSQTGEILWKKRFSINETLGMKAAEDPFSNLFFNSGVGITKANSNGNVLWRRFSPDTTSAMYIAFTNDNTRLFCYGVNYVSLFDTSGNQIWYRNQRDPDNYNLYLHDVAQNAGFYYFSGFKVFNGYEKGFIKKFDINGNLLWTKFTEQNSRLYSIAANSDNSLIAAGRKNFNLYCLKIDQYENIIWERSYVQDSLVNAYSIDNAGNNRFVLATGGYEAKSKCVIIDSSGNIIINKDHPYGLHDNVLYQNVMTANDSGFVFTGYIELNEMGPVDWLVVKTDKFGNTTPIGIEQISSGVPSEFKLYQNFPNPFNPSTKIRFEIPYTGGVSEGRGVSLKFIVFDIAGREVYSISETNPPGIYEITFDASRFSSGMYFYSLEAGSYKQTRKMVLLK